MTENVNTTIKADQTAFDFYSVYLTACTLYKIAATTDLREVNMWYERRRRNTDSVEVQGIPPGVTNTCSDDAT